MLKIPVSPGPLRSGILYYTRLSFNKNLRSNKGTPNSKNLNQVVFHFGQYGSRPLLMFTTSESGLDSGGRGGLDLPT